MPAPTPVSPQNSTCAQCRKPFDITAADQAFYAKLNVPAPTWCPRCRMIRRFTFRNLRALYKRPAHGSNNQSVLSCFPADSPLPVYTQATWNGDSWSGFDFARDYDFTRPFFTQFAELLQATPWPTTLNLHVENSDFCNQVSHLKNCYLLFNSGFDEDCLYSTNLLNSKNTMDCLNVTGCELSYELIDCGKCYQCAYLQDSKNCSNVWFSINMMDCHDCFGCVNLRNKRFYIFNEPYTEVEYRRKLGEIFPASAKQVKNIQERVQVLRLKQPVRFMHSTRNENVTGDYLLNCKNAQQCFMSQDLEDCSYCQLILFGASKDSYDISIAVGERCYEIQEAGGYNVQFSWRNMPKNLATGAINLDNLQYTVHCSNVSDLFACVGMRNARYCIFNKQYSKEEYFALRTKIIEHMKEMPYTDAHGRTYSYGEFFPPELSPFAYNETIAQEYFPLTKAEALAQGYRWRDEDHKTYSTTLRAADLPDTPATAAANMRQLTKDTITCAHQGTCTHQCTGAYRIIEAELAFYQRLKLPLPHLCPNCRHYGRLAQRNPIALYPRQCTCTLAGHNSHTANTQCPTTFQTSYAPNRPEKIYCEYCYQKEIL